MVCSSGVVQQSLDFMFIITLSLSGVLCAYLG